MLRDDLLFDLEYEKTRVLMWEALYIFLRNCEGLMYTKKLEPKAVKYFSERFPYIKDLVCRKRNLEKYESLHEFHVSATFKGRDIMVYTHIGSDVNLRVEERIWKPLSWETHSAVPSIEEALRIVDTPQFEEDLAAFKKMQEEIAEIRKRYLLKYYRLRGVFDEES